MTNLALHLHLATKYTDLAYTHSYVFTFNFGGLIYAVTLHNLTAAELVNITTVSKASRGAGYALRFRPTKSTKMFLISKGAEVLCSKAYFENLVASHKYNKGETAEMLVTEQMFGQTWAKDSVPFTKGGDVEFEGIAYQHKHEGATFCNEKSLRNLA
jgi:hypothetical protein